ncbi:helix-turn-helix domain-containing protein [Burkholderia thailandensis]|uniref:helix-turn-helix domain-containing protein n=2 Tax=Burkholderia thailandensis TaxID=57975 RepID=UPI0005154DC9|nr:helix-turn-helix domain-containing protein [Burkholderia thailandensis]AIS97871.1 helix-turn-helix family protein [Burkholderia thailandensis MSMB59]AIT24643.1 helix-turn-helix family protein [Burkholderia thailandensis E254]AOJ47832.1 gluconate transporter [Burkholderia thailandensis]KVG18121.1 gluconate transporter [Burkholderia thailandensis]KVG20685.1 gluconate transporter [Burkholderia thailandensis]
MTIIIEHEIRTLDQLRPILRGLRKSAGLTQAMLARRLGVTQQTYAQFEGNPASASVERLFNVLRALDIELALTLTHVRAASAQPAAQQEIAAPARNGKVAKSSAGARAAAEHSARPARQPAPAALAPRPARKRAAPKKRDGR